RRPVSNTHRSDAGFEHGTKCSVIVAKEILGCRALSLRDRDKSYGPAFRHRVRASLDKDSPRPRPVQLRFTGNNIIAFPEVGGLHHLRTSSRSDGVAVALRELGVGIDFFVTRVSVLVERFQSSNHMRPSK